MADLSAKSLMGVTKDNTTGLWKLLENSLLDIMARAGSMAYTDGVAGKDNLHFVRQYLPGRSVAHIAADRMNLFALEGVQDGKVDQIPGMNDRVASCKGGSALP